MNRITYNKLNLKVNDNTNKIKIGENEIEVFQYLPIRDKSDLIYAALRKSQNEYGVDHMLVDVYFHLYIVYMYTNIVFTQKQKEDEMKLYDALSSNGILEKIIEAMNEQEYNFLYDALENIIVQIDEYKKSAAAVINKMVNDMPRNAEKAAEIVENFNPDKYKGLMNTAIKAGMPVVKTK